MNKEEIEKMELEYTNAIRERIENAEKCGIGLDAVLTIGNRMIKLQDRIDKAIDKLKSMLPMCIMPNNMLIHGTEKARIIEETVNILEGEDNE